ncbi:MAG: alkylhydroperoxidase [Hyphomicrobiales bacterium]|nr:MAG: alkylhydroperoxidase [Hyphomicrobiales bacterium]
MSKNYVEITDRISRNVNTIAELQPDVMKNFSAMAAAATADGVLDLKTKELIALAIGITQHCDGCIGYHIKTLVGLGATKEEVAETLSTCIYMGGGPALMYAADAMQAYDQFSPQ